MKIPRRVPKNGLYIYYNMLRMKYLLRKTHDSTFAYDKFKENCAEVTATSKTQTSSQGCDLY